jgi:uncharacterized protein YjcR
MLNLSTLSYRHCRQFRTRGVGEGLHVAVSPCLHGIKKALAGTSAYVAYEGWGLPAYARVGAVYAGIRELDQMTSQSGKEKRPPRMVTRLAQVFPVPTSANQTVLLVCVTSNFIIPSANSMGYYFDKNICSHVHNGGRKMEQRICGAKTRSGHPCKNAPMANGRCKFHGGMSTGPKDREKHRRSMLGKQNALKHGFFAKLLTEEDLALVAEIVQKDPTEILWENIVIQYVAIIKAQRLMRVRNQEDHSDFAVEEVETQTRDGKTVHKTVRKERQWAWDKHAQFLQVQSRAMAALESMLARYEQMCDQLRVQRQELEVEKLRAEIERMKNGGTTGEIEAWIDGVMKAAEKRRLQRDQVPSWGTNL